MTPLIYSLFFKVLIQTKCMIGTSLHYRDASPLGGLKWGMPALIGGSRSHW